ncbi:Hypothetical protein, putative [Bodo saltans]|uniref:Uncharacterized protein n=1 Tax=Bodo saltans TaxID=75058 RepID=A0A0S4JJR2_BODSA|nr:Hypothetical protein, putative [Bodo saltans]|eukprot:CUG90586.1 Hypothetical protein, putative [Bodo saltans]
MLTNVTSVGAPIRTAPLARIELTNTTVELQAGMSAFSCDSEQKVSTQRGASDSVLSTPVDSFLFQQQHRDDSVSSVDDPHTVSPSDFPLDAQLEVAHLDVLISDAIVQARYRSSPATPARAQIVLQQLLQRILIVAIASGDARKSNQENRY